MRPVAVRIGTWRWNSDPDRRDDSLRLAPFRAPYAAPDAEIAARLLAEATRPAEAERRIDARATRLIEGIRAQAGGLGGIEDFLHAYSLSTKEGLALMVLAEALLRVPDAATADRLIEDKLATGDWDTAELKSDAFLVSASAWTLGITARIIQPGETPENILEGLLKRLGLPAVRAATRQAMRLLGSHFVLGQTIEEALRRAGSHPKARYSFDMLGEGARTAADARRYLEAYASAIDAIGASAGDGALPDRPGISVKLSALHPRFEAVSRERVLEELVPDVLALARKARGHDLNFTIDAEEADRLELTLDVIAQGACRSFAARLGRIWARGAGLSEARRSGDRLARRDRASAATPADGAPGEGRLLGHRGQARAGARARRISRVHPQGDDRSLLRRLHAAAAGGAGAAVSAVRHPQCAHGRERDRGCRRGRRLRIPAAARHGRGALRDVCARRCRSAAVRVYAPVGGHRDLLAYLVRRLLENGANSSFVAVAADPSVPVEALLKRPQSWIGDPRTRAIRTSRCRGICMRRRGATPRASSSVTRQASMRSWRRSALPMRRRTRPPDADEAASRCSHGGGGKAFPAWQATPVEERAAILERAGDLSRRGAGG